MRRICNVDKTWDALRAISPSDYYRYFFIKLDKEFEYFSVDRLDGLSLDKINRLLHHKNVMLIYVEGDDEEW